MSLRYRTVLAVVVALVTVGVCTHRFNRHPEVVKFVTELRSIDSERGIDQSSLATEMKSISSTGELNTATKLAALSNKLSKLDSPPSCGILKDRYLKLLTIVNPLTERIEETIRGGQKAWDDVTSLKNSERSDDEIHKQEVAKAASDADAALTEICKRFGIDKEFDIKPD